MISQISSDKSKPKIHTHTHMRTDLKQKKHVYHRQRHTMELDLQHGYRKLTAKRAIQNKICSVCVCDKNQQNGAETRNRPFKKLEKLFISLTPTVSNRFKFPDNHILIKRKITMKNAICESTIRFA